MSKRVQQLLSHLAESRTPGNDGYFLGDNPTAESAVTTEYLVVGSGAMGLTFVDTLLTENTKAMVVLVDRLARPGGHWSTAYPFVRLHQPSAFYGAGSVRLDGGRVDREGGNAGLAELATGAEVAAYWDNLLRNVLLPTGRLRYLPLHDYDYETGLAKSLMNGTLQRISACKVVNAT
jgi:hypothetical protein